MLQRLRVYGPIVWAAIVSAALLGWFGGHAYDDPFITYRYAQNLAAGLGFVYNSGERVLSTTTPLYALILAAARLFGADIPTFSNALGALSLALGGLALWRLGLAWRAPLAGLAAMLVYPLFPLLVTTLGSELPLYLALVLGATLAYAHERYLAAAALLALAALIRADGVLAAGVLGAAFLLQRRRPLPWRALALYLALLLPWLAFAQLYFGAPFPATLEAKRRQALLPGSELFLPGLLAQLRDNYWRYAEFRPMFTLAALGLVAALRRRGPWLIPIGWSALYTAAYAALGVTSYFWYYGPVIVGLAALVGLGLDALAGLARRGWGHPAAAWAVALALGLQLLRVEYQGLLFLKDHRDTRVALYQAAGEWLRANTPPDARVGTLEVGIIGYYAQRPMLDFAGLLQPPVAQQLSPASSYDAAAVWAFQRYRPRYLVLQDGALPRLQHEAAPAGGCHPVHELRDAVYAYPLIIFACGSA